MISPALEAIDIRKSWISGRLGALPEALVPADIIARSSAVQRCTCSRIQCR